MSDSKKQLADIRKTTDLTMTEFNRIEKAVKAAFVEGKKKGKT